ncbi:MAG: hypothetical protein DGJ47_001115, partial [Rickettsiaceae bacterium]
AYISKQVTPGTENNEIKVIDTAGYNDSKPADEVLNTVFNARSGDSSEKQIFALVVDNSELSARNGGLIDSIRQTANSFSQIDPLENSIALIVTKTPQHKSVEDVIQQLENFLKARNDLTSSECKLLGFVMKSVHVVAIPSEEGEVTYPNLLQDIVESTVPYCGPNLANVAISERAKPYAETMLNIVSNDFNQMLGIIQNVLQNPIKCLKNEKLNPINYSYERLIQPWIVNFEHAEGKGLDYITPGNDFSDLDFLAELKQVFDNKNYNGENEVNFTEKANHLRDVIKVIEQFSVDNACYQLRLNNFMFALKQSTVYVELFSKLCGKELTDIAPLMKFIAECRSVSDANLKQAVLSTKIEEEQNEAYYHKASEFMDMYSEEDICQKNKAKASLHLGQIYEDAKDSVNAEISYFKAITANPFLEGAHRKLAALYKEQGNLVKAAQYYLNTNSIFSAEQCWKKIVKKSPDSAEIREKAGDFFAAVHNTRSAHKHYQAAFSLLNSSMHPEAKSNLASKLSRTAPNEEVMQKYSEMSVSGEFNDFSRVTDAFLEQMKPVAEIGLLGAENYDLEDYAEF